VQRRSERHARLVVAGDADPASPAGRASALALHEAIERAGVSADVRRPGSIDDVPGLLAAADVLVSVSAWRA